MINGPVMMKNNYQICNSNSVKYANKNVSVETKISEDQVRVKIEKKKIPKERNPFMAVVIPSIVKGSEAIICDEDNQLQSAYANFTHN